VLALASAQEPPFKANVSLVEIDAEIIGQGGVIEGLQAADSPLKATVNQFLFDTVCQSRRLSTSF
jgi:hypothetical protein